jgi:hypothetical protein
LFREFGDHLNRAWAVADDADDFVFDFDLRVPARGMELGFWEGFDAFDFGPTPFIQEARAVDEDVAFVFDYGGWWSGQVADLNAPFPIALVPDCFFDLVIKLGEAVDLVSFVEVPTVIADLGRASVVFAPVVFWIEGESVDMSRYITRAARVAIFCWSCQLNMVLARGARSDWDTLTQPSPANIMVLLVYRQLKGLQQFLHLVRQT